MAEQTLTIVVQEACAQGVSTRVVDDPVRSLGMSDISQSQVSRLYGEFDGKLRGFLDRQLKDTY